MDLDQVIIQKGNTFGQIQVIVEIVILGGTLGINTNLMELNKKFSGHSELEDFTNYFMSLLITMENMCPFYGEHLNEFTCQRVKNMLQKLLDAYIDKKRFRHIGIIYNR